MVNLEYGNEVYLEDFDVTITQDFLTLEQIEALVNTCLSCENQLQRDQIIISSICAVCTDMYNDEEATYTFEEVLYSGLWTTILENAPWLKVAVDIIDREVAEHNSINKKVMSLIDTITDKVESVEVDKLIGAVINAIGEVFTVAVLVVLGFVSVVLASAIISSVHSI